MNLQCFSIDKIPDLTLSKYSFLDEGGVNGVLKKTSVFLRQMNSEGLLVKTFSHLLYTYNPDKPIGQRINLLFILSGNDNNSLLYTQRLVESSALSSFFDFKHLNKEEHDELMASSKTYSHVAALLKRVFTVESSIIRPDEKEMKLHRLANWKMNEDARLYNLFQLMRSLNKPAAFRVDLFPVDYAADLRSVLPIQELRTRTSMRASSGVSGFSFQRDENAEETQRQYESIIKDYESTPHFRVNILAFANELDVACRLANAAGAEALESGTYRIEPIKQPQGQIEQYNIFEYMMNKPVPTTDIAGLNTLESLAFLPSLFLLDEIRPFFTFPALHDGETIEIPKETAPSIEARKEEKELHINIDFNNIPPGHIPIGIDENKHPVSIEVKLFKKHVFIAGVPGSGKTNTMLYLTTTLWKNYGIPFLILEPAKKEYRALTQIDGMEDLLIFSPSSGTMFPLHINPFEFPAGMRLSEHIRNLMSVFEGAFQLAGPAPFLIDSAMEAIYRKKGWHPHTENPNYDGKIILTYPTLSEFYERISIEVDAAGYEGETKSNVKTFVEVRLGSLLRREMGDVFDVSHSTLSPEEWLLKPALIELEAMGSGPANFLTLLLCTLIRETLKVASRDNTKYEEKPRHVLFLEEAHNLIGPEAEEATGEQANPKLAATAYIVKMLAEVRALHEGIVIADQLPTKMAPEVIKNTGIKIGHRLTAEDDRNLMGSTMSASPIQLEQMAMYGVGEALIATEKLQRPYKSKIRKWQEDDSKYEPPSDENLFRILFDSQNTAYDKQLKLSMEICYAKFYREKETFIDEMNRMQFDNKYVKVEAHKKVKELAANEEYQMKLNNDKMELDKHLAKLLSSMANLFHRAKGYFEQNPIYKLKMEKFLKNLQKIWKYLYELAEKWHPESALKHKKDNNEITKFEGIKEK